jgi:hypothetical protein
MRNSKENCSPPPIKKINPPVSCIVFGLRKYIPPSLQVLQLPHHVASLGNFLEVVPWSNEEETLDFIRYTTGCFGRENYRPSFQDVELLNTHRPAVNLIDY